MSETTDFELTTLHSLKTPDQIRESVAISSKVPVPTTPAEVTRELFEINEARLAEDRASRRETGTVVDIFA